uniref:Cytochrome c oxidase subunit 3 n=1 Tax=Gongylonema pulchrum TaxID=637853 RepID=A0A0D3MTE9_9BILA|nr:cytochrome c oxidase subunit III [Gongylonema pulchrum]AIY56387.1 cytochrome c oxidase subunit 3 [Gongylonema pulchrum]BAV82717.1 cytochrome c oxidase subunit III [Gongylonema pulchrum]
MKFRKCHKMAYSFYPYLAGLGVLSFDLCLLMFMKLGLLSMFFICMFFLIYISYLWLKDVFFENISGQYSLEDCRMFRQGFRLFLFSELALFFTIFWTFLDSSFYSVMWISGFWSPLGVLSPDYIGLNALASSFLMINSHILKYSRRFLFLSDLKCEIFMLLCIFIGGGFVCFQAFEYNNNPFTFTDSMYGSVFYIGTGLHGSHVIVGVCFLVINFLRIKFFHMNWFNSQAFDMSIDYWRFLEWMWGFMFCLLYVWGN